MITSPSTATTSKILLSFAFFSYLVYTLNTKRNKNDETKNKNKEKESDDSEEVARLRSLLASNKLIHPYLTCNYFQRKIQQQQQSLQNDAGIVETIEEERGKEKEDIISLNFTDLAAALALCCGASLPHPSSLSTLSLSDANYNNEKEKERKWHLEMIHNRRIELANKIGSGNGKTTKRRKHVIFVLCDGMGTSILDQHLRSSNGTKEDNDSNIPFLLKHNNNNRTFSQLKAVFPSTTPAALTTLATATYPGKHGLPGWDLRDTKGCDFPGVPLLQGPVQIRILAEQVMDVRSDTPVAEKKGFEDLEKDVFVEQPWSAQILTNGCKGESDSFRRKLVYINAYNGDDFPNWYQSVGKAVNDNGNTADETINNNGKYNDATKTTTSTTDFSSWQMGQINHNNDHESKDDNAKKNNNDGNNNSEKIDTIKPQQKEKEGWITAKTISETSYKTLGQPKGSSDAIQYFAHGIDEALRIIAQSESKEDGKYNFIYLYTAHPDKHMHSLGVEHDEVGNVVRGINHELERLWNVLGDRDNLMKKYCLEEDSGPKTNVGGETSSKERVDAALIVTADHGHVAVQPSEMIELPQDILDCLEYANLGVHGKGRHAYLHCRPGLQATLRKRWRANPKLTNNFLLLTIEEAIDNGLFGPEPPNLKVRPRMGDFVSISLGAPTLVSPAEAAKYRNVSKTDGNAAPRCQGAHGSLLPEEMCIPFVFCVPP